MKIKSIVLTAALATAFSAFSDSASVDVDWFTTNAISVVKFDRNINDPVVVTNSVAAPLETAYISGYAITAYVTNLVVFAAKPGTELPSVDTKSAKGAICAAVEGATTNWYGLSTSGWQTLTNLGTPVENASYALKMEFKNDSGAKVRYSVNGTNGLTENDGWLASTGLYEKPDFYAFAGMGFCTNIVGEVFIDVPAGSAGVDVQDANGIPVGRIIIETEKLDADEANDPGANGLKKWVNYVLGISNTDAAAKPYAAPVQNSDPSVLTFELGGVDAEKVLGQSVTGAKVTYTVETLESPTATSGTSGDYVEPNDPVSVNLDSEHVKYYRIKIKIDPAH